MGMHIKFPQTFIKLSGSSIAYQVAQGGYIPYGNPGGRHIMDDFGNLVQSLPQDQFDYQYHGLEWRAFWDMDTYYMFH